jgi:hypothetical protein
LETSPSILTGRPGNFDRKTTDSFPAFDGPYDAAVESTSESNQCKSPFLGTPNRVRYVEVQSQADTADVYRQSESSPHAESLPQSPHVRVDGFPGHTEGMDDLLVGHTGDHAAKDFDAPRGQMESLGGSFPRFVAEFPIFQGTPADAKVYLSWPVSLLFQLP